MRAPIHSRKHLVQYPFDGITTGTRQVIPLVRAVERTTANAATEVVEGAIVKAIFIELWLQNASTDGHQIVTVTKDIEDATGPSFTEMAALDSYNNKKNILFTHEGLSASDNAAGPVRVLGNWLKVPKSKQRFGLGDKINLNISNPSSTDLNRCGVTIYKEYT